MIKKLFPLLMLSFPAICQSVTGHLQSTILDEISGVVESKKYKDRLYVHNDSGDGNRFYTINKKGKLICIINFESATKVIDCEDIDLGPGPVKGASYIYLADIGDNLGFRNTVSIYRMQEPLSFSDTITIKADKIILRYPDGARDAESIFIDPLEKMLYILSKREDSQHIYRLALDVEDGDTVVPVLYGKLMLGNGKKENWIVSASMTGDGRHLLIKTINNVYYWNKKKGEALYTTLQGKPVKQSTYQVRGQEEAIAFTADAKNFYILSEGKSSSIWLYPLQTSKPK